MPDLMLIISSFYGAYVYECNPYVSVQQMLWLWVDGCSACTIHIWLLSLATIMFESGAHAGTAAGVSVVYTLLSCPVATCCYCKLASLSPVGIGALLFQLDWLLAGRVNTRGNRNAAGWLREKWDPYGTGSTQQQQRRANGRRDLKRKCI